MVQLLRFLLLSLFLIRPAVSAPLPGFVVHFDFFSTPEEGRQLVRIAAQAGAQVVNVVPPAHVWERPAALRMLDAVLDEIARLHLRLVFTRIDAAFPPDTDGTRFNYLYGNILSEPGVLPNGERISHYFLTTVGLPRYDAWMEEETRFYASRYGRLPNLIGIDLGPFSEPFSAERCGFLEYSNSSRRYEITQYTAPALRLWRRWLAARYLTVQRLNREYDTRFTAFDQVPLPRAEDDARFGKPALAYFDFARSLNDWFVARYERCRRIWHQVSGREDVPFILQFSGGELEKFMRGRPSFAAFDIAGWVARADAFGLSLYTNGGFPDLGHGSVRATSNLAALARDLGKDVFVLEGGHEAPNVLLDATELAFFGSVALRLQPRTYIYEFLKDKFDEPYRSNPGKLVTATGQIRPLAFEALRNLFQKIASSNLDPETPALYAISDPFAARGQAGPGQLNAALADLAARVAVRWIPLGVKVPQRPGVPVVSPQGVVTPPNEKLTRLFQDIPPVDSPERDAWRRQALDLLH